MKRIPLLNVVLCLAVLLIGVACRSQEEPATVVTFDPEATAFVATAVAGTVESMTAAMRGDETTREVSAQGSTLTTGPATDATVDAAGIIYSVPFAVRPDGFGFRNYGSGFPEGDFTVADLRAQFGDGVCSRIEADGDRCIPSAEALQWIADRNADMSYGHCIGFTVTSYRFTQGDIQPYDFAANAIVPYDIGQQAAIMRTIAANGSLYWVKSVWSSEVSGTPQEVLDALIALGEPVDLSIYLPGLAGGHSLLAYGVEEVAPQQYHILVYDNNYPGEDAFVEVDYAANTWRYAQGAVNPGETAVPYQGDATTQTLRFIPLSAYESAACPFCAPDAGQSDETEAFTLISLIGQGDVLVKTALGNIGVVAGEIINDLPGARLIFQRGQLSAYDTPDIVLPAGIDYAVEFNNMQRVSSLSQESSVVLDKLTPATETSSLAVDFTNGSIAFQAGGDQSPILKATVRQDEATFSVALLGVDYTDGQGVTMSAAKDDGALEIQSNDAELSDGTLLIARLTPENEAIFATNSLTVEANSQVALDLSGWDGEGNIAVYSDEDGDGAYEEQPTQLPNVPVAQIMQQSDPAAVADIVDNLSPFIGDDSMDTILSTLADQDLSGQEIAAILRPMDLTDEHLVSLLQTYDLPLTETAELIFHLRLEPDRVDAIILGLDLTAEDEVALRDVLDNLAQYQSILSEWDFRNSQDMVQLAALLAEYDLTAEQLVDLLPRFDLGPADLVTVLGNMTLSVEDLEFVVEKLGLNMSAVHAVTPVAVTPRPITPTPSPTITITATVTATPATTPTVTAAAADFQTATPTETATPDGTLPLPTMTPAPYPYPGALPAPTRTPVPYPYPGPSASATPAFQSRAFCDGDDIHIVAKELGWLDAAVEVWLGETKLVEGKTGPSGEAFETTFTGPSTWEGLYLISGIEPYKVPLAAITCP